MNTFDTSFLVMEVAGHKDHRIARAIAESLRRRGDRFVIVPQVLAEFLHIVTDSRRFSSPLAMEQALHRAEAWWNSREVDWASPDETTVTWVFHAMAEQGLDGPDAKVRDAVHVVFAGEMVREEYCEPVPKNNAWTQDPPRDVGRSTIA